jgi:hypothetical protein
MMLTFTSEFLLVPVVYRKLFSIHVCRLVGLLGMFYC